MSEPQAEKKFFLNPKIILIAVIAILLATGTSFFMTNMVLKAHNQGANGQQASKQEVPEFYSASQDFTVRLADQHFLKMSMSLAIDDKKMEEEITARIPQIRDAVITICMGKKVDDLNNNKGKEKFAHEIKEQLNSFLTEGQIVEIYFTDFVVQ